MADSSVASASARREARKRRLLLSSEERLKKIIQLNENTKGDTEEGKEIKTHPVTDVAAAVTVSAPPLHSENAEEGESQFSLPTETRKEEISSSVPRENIETEGSSQKNETEEIDHCDEATETGNPSLELKLESNIDVESSAPSKTDTKKTSRQACPTQDMHPDKTQETLTISSQDNPILSSCSPSLHSPFPSNQTPCSNLPTKPHHHIPPRPPSQNIPSSSVLSAPSSTTQPQTNTVQDTSRVAPPPPIEKMLATRELFVVFVAFMMRLMLALDWLTHFGMQSIIIPFVAMQALFFSLNKGSQQPPGGMLSNILRMAAMFSNIPVASINKLQVILSVVNDAMADLALYLFVFLATHGVIELISAVGLSILG